jgi:putative SOS response-associated peptidase YedK
MCNRYSRDAQIQAVWQRFQADGIFEHGPNSIPYLQKSDFNIAPQNYALTVFTPDNRRKINSMIFGLAPAWCYGKKITNRFMNARAETLTDKLAFKDLLSAKRCLIPATGFYEWKKEDGRKQPYHFRLKGGGLFAFAGLWDKWRSSDTTAAESYSFAIITTAPNELCATVHDRMPVILDEEAEKRWLDPDEHDTAKLLPLLKAYPADAMERYPVDPRMGYARFNDRRCVEPWEGKGGQLTFAMKPKDL